MTRLFGTDLEPWREFRDGTLARHLQAENWPDLFITQLERHISLKRTHILPPEIKRQNETTIYFLIYGTRHWKGVKAMKVAMWKSDRSAAKKLGQASEPLRQQLLEYLATKPPRIEFAIEDLEEYVPLHTMRSETLKSVLKSLEKDGFITGHGRINQFTYPEKSTVILEGQRSSSRIRNIRPQRPKRREVN